MTSDSEHHPLFCCHCGDHLTPGRGDFYVVRIEAFADPTPPADPDGRATFDPGEEIDRLIRQMEGMSERELMDQVHRRMTIHLCGPCYATWIEDPTSRSRNAKPTR